MSPADYFMLADPLVSGVFVAAGYGMLAYGDRKIKAIRACFWIAAIGIGSLGVVWGVWGADESQPLSIRLIVAGVTGAIAAVGLTLGLWHLREHITPSPSEIAGPGGPGGKAEVIGEYSGAEGGTGGRGGLGPGGTGGDAKVKGDNSFARGGDGGNAGQPDGRGGQRTMSPGEQLNLPTDMWQFGHGGRGANAPEYDRRLKILTEIREAYFKAFPDDVIFIQAGIDQVPIKWVNKRLEEIGENWRVTIEDGGYKMPPLDAP
jgi:hypothetical protein